jgi:hypothetical protein
MPIRASSTRVKHHGILDFHAGHANIMNSLTFMMRHHDLSNVRHGPFAKHPTSGKCPHLNIILRVACNWLARCLFIFRFALSSLDFSHVDIPSRPSVYNDIKFAPTISQGHNKNRVARF